MKTTSLALSALALSIVLIIGLPANSSAQGRVGFGFVLGVPTGVAWNYKTGRNNAIDGAIGVLPDDRLRIHMDYLWHSHPFRDDRLSLHYGPGVVFGFSRDGSERRDRSLFGENQTGVGLRGVLGLTYEVTSAPLDLFFELGPVIVLAPRTASDVDIGFGTRFYP